MTLHRVSADDPASAAALLQGEAPRLIFKHSPTCGISRKAFTEVSQFVEAHPDVPVYLVDVIAQRALSQQIALLLGIAHASPQVILVADDAPLWNASHRAVTSEAIARAINSLPPSDAR